MAIAGVALPPRLQQGLNALFADNLYFVPVRHHSPACARATQALISEIRPVAVLIEGPESFSGLIPLLLDTQTRPPVAILCQTPARPAAAMDGGGASPGTAFFPFCEYSPEWVALREGAAVGATLAFIDLPWRDKAWLGDAAAHTTRNLMAERYLAHSAYLSALAQRAGCRDQSDLWDHLFELRPLAQLRDWRTLLADVFSYCAMARLDYETEVLEAEGSLPRERHMAAHIARLRACTDGPIVVVTGGFHTAALLELLQQPTPALAAATAPATDDAWLIRYSDDRLDALNGYASGMPSPAYYRQVWQAQETGAASYLQQVALHFLTSMARETREQNLHEQISVAAVQNALLQAVRLAALRGHAGPGRYDLIDAMRSCFIKTADHDGTAGFNQSLHRWLGGNRLGQIPPSAGSPPLLENVRQQARALGIALQDTDVRVTRLDVYRKRAHVRRSRFFHLMQYLDARLAQWQGGPDFLHGTRLELLFEEWRYAWTPTVEARLIELSSLGQTLADAGLARLRAEQQALDAAGAARSAASAVQLVIRACLVGLHDQVPLLLDRLGAYLSEDATFESVVLCGHRLATLWRAREPLGAQQHPTILALMRQCWTGALYLLPGLAQVSVQHEAAAIRDLGLLREFGQALREAATDVGPSEPPPDTAPLHAQLLRLLDQPEVAAGLAGAAGATLVLDSQLEEIALGQRLQIRFGAGADPAEAVRFLTGLMTVAPELLLRRTDMLQALNQLIANWDEDHFITHLPELREAFARLKPQETADMARWLAELNGAPVVQTDLAHMQVSAADLPTTTRIDADLARLLQRDGLGSWLLSRNSHDE